jgi:tetratricopeptide (TPR) repeat protein
VAEQIIEDHPDSALFMLKNLPSYKYKSGSNRALYGLLMIQTLDKKQLPLKPLSLLNFSIAWYEEHLDGERLATCYLYKGRTYKYCFQYDKAMIFYLKALDKAQNSKNNILLGRINLDMGDIFNLQRDFLDARQKYKLSYTYFKNANLQNLAFYSYLNIGRTYHEAKDYKSAQIIYQKTLFQAKDSMQLGALYQEMGQNFYDSGKFDTALNYCRRIIKYPYIGNNLAIRYNLLADIFFAQNIFDSSYYCASTAFQYNPDIRTQRECYRIMTNCDFIKGNTRNVTTYMNKYVTLGDSIRKIDTQIKGSYMETMHKAKKEASQSKNLVWYLSCLVLLVLVGSYLYYILYSRRTKKEKVELHQTLSDEKTEKLIKFIDEKATILHLKIDERKLAVLSEYKTASIQDRENQIRKIYDDLLHINDTNFFLKDRNADLNNLVTKLQNRYNGLNEKQLIWCCLHLLRISNYDMLIIFNYKNDNSLKGLKKRLMKKFNLESVTHFHDFLIAILSEN